MGGVRHFLAVKGHGQPLRVGGFVRIGLFEGRKAVQGKLGGAYAFFHQPFTASGQPCQSRFRQHYGRVALLAAQLHCGGNGLADVGGGDLFPRAKAHGQHPGNGKVGMPVQQGQFARLALEVAQGRGYDQPGSNLVQFRNLLKQGFVLADGGQQNVPFPLFRSEILKAYIHRAASPESALRTGRQRGERCGRRPQGACAVFQLVNILRRRVFAKGGQPPARGIPGTAADTGIFLAAFVHICCQLAAKLAFPCSAGSYAQAERCFFVTHRIAYAALYTCSFLLHALPLLRFSFKPAGARR